jgi:hypothetical protein
MKKSNKQYTIRNIPLDLDRNLRSQAKATGKSFNQVALEALIRGSGESIKPQRNFSEVIGSMSAKEASQIESAIRMQRQVDMELWK